MSQAHGNKVLAMQGLMLGFVFMMPFLIRPVIRRLLRRTQVLIRACDTARTERASRPLFSFPHPP
eukprot:scaffold43597_cov33-Tisochrysis_lutea.AAC.3